MYNLKYDFKQYNYVIGNYLEVLTNKSVANFQYQVKIGQIANPKRDVKALRESIPNIEEYLYYNFINHPNNFNSILNTTINNVKTLSCLPDSQRGIYGKSEAQNKAIFIHPQLGSSKTLTGEERTRLYMAHELGHMVNNQWMKDVIEYANRQIRLGVLPKEKAELIYDGFSLLNEATTQERAEEFVYSYSKKDRPRQALYRNGRLFNAQPYKANFDYYGELQEPATIFARTLRGIGKENNDAKALKLLADRAISPKFFNSILSEYAKDGQMDSFIKEVQYMGLLKRASYANFGYGDESYLKNSAKYLEEFKNVTLNMRDYREPFTEQYDK